MPVAVTHRGIEITVTLADREDADWLIRVVNAWRDLLPEAPKVLSVELSAPTTGTPT